MEQKAKQDGVTLYCLETSSRPEEAAANRFYEQHGFTLAGRIPAFWHNAEQRYYYKVLTGYG
jgi:ribosomal protein S18 acetylase RimI-like enzyme